MKGKNPRVQISRGNTLLGEYHPLQIGSLLETGFLKETDLCLKHESTEWIPLKTFLENVDIPGFSRTIGEDEPLFIEDDPSLQPAATHNWIAWVVAALALAAALGAGLWAWKVSQDQTSLTAAIARSEAANAELKKQYQNVLFAARETASNDLVRGRVIIRKDSGKRMALPDIKVRLYSRKTIEDHLAERQANIPDAAGTNPAHLSLHFLKDLPPPAAITTSGSDGRFEMKIPEPGEYILQTSIRSAKTGQHRLWFVAFDSRDPLNTPVDITESNAVRQFNPLFMIVEGR